MRKQETGGGEGGSEMGCKERRGKRERGGDCAGEFRDRRGSKERKEISS